MKAILILGALFAGSTSALAQSNPSDHYVGGYTTNRGTYVEPHYQTNPNSSTNDNYGTSGNYNPHTGGYGTRSPY